jgi:hypothetical protein
MIIQICVYCNKESSWREQFWSLNNYHSLTGVFCVDCYEKVSHNADGNPVHPEEYLIILLKQENKNGKEKTD